VTTSWKVFVLGLRVEAEVGLYPHERGRLQPLTVDVELDLSEGPIVRLRDTVDYDRVVAAARNLAASGHIDLIETYAERLAATCLSDTRAIRARVRVQKPQAAPEQAAVGVEVVVSAN
jgi:dihydroneopterin aldolase